MNYDCEFPITILCESKIEYLAILNLKFIQSLTFPICGIGDGLNQYARDMTLVTLVTLVTLLEKVETHL